ncbi:MAG TPA: ABC transporter ATP-binding protein [Candidatus Brocadiia bacterium]|nr:ABC transporter ATP-binding protein [Candidatus Brocadiia bacterium]
MKEITQELKKGDCLGVIGPNGAGKSTLLKLICGILRPDRGRIITRGRIGALIELGAGMHPYLSARENIYINAAIMGMSRRETQARFDSIVEFAGVGEFLDMPVKHYSSGMFVRLGFSVAAHCEPDLLLVDEVLAVGDAAFQVKCGERMRKVLKSGCALIVVSHDISMILNLVQYAICLDKGRVVAHGDPVACADAYYHSSTRPQDAYQAVGEPTMGYGEDFASATIAEVILNCPGMKSEAGLFTGEPADCFVIVKTKKPISNPVVGIMFQSADGASIFGTNTKLSGLDIPILNDGDRITLQLPSLPLPSGVYTVRAALSDNFMLPHAPDRFVPVRVTSRKAFAGSSFWQHEWKIVRAGEGSA